MLNQQETYSNEEWYNYPTTTTTTTSPNSTYFNYPQYYETNSQSYENWYNTYYQTSPSNNYATYQQNSYYSPSCESSTSSTTTTTNSYPSFNSSASFNSSFDASTANLNNSYNWNYSSNEVLKVSQASYANYYEADSSSSYPQPTQNSESQIYQPQQEIKETKLKERQSKRHHHQQLPDRAVDIMDEWFSEHVNNPYPSLSEKEKLAQRGGITVKQVTAWFSNRRNRSQNTKPKRMKRVLEKEMNCIYNELVCNPDKQQVIQKFRATLVSQNNF